MDADPDLSAAIEAVWLRHRDLMFKRLDSIDAAIAAAATDDLDKEARVAAHRDAHKLAGSLGTFGLHEGTACARRIELAFDGDGPVDVADMQEAARTLRAQLESR